MQKERLTVQGQAEITIVIITMIMTFDYVHNYDNCANYGAHVFVDGHGCALDLCCSFLLHS